MSCRRCEARRRVRRRYALSLGEISSGQDWGLRSGSANLNSAISGNSGHYAGPKTAWREGVFDGQEISAA